MSLGQLHQQLGFRARNKHTRCHRQVQIPPGTHTRQVLQRLGSLHIGRPQDGQLAERGAHRQSSAGIKAQTLQRGPVHAGHQLQQPVELLWPPPFHELLAAPGQQLTGSQVNLHRLHQE